MRAIPKHQKDQISNNPYFQKCARRAEGICQGRITIEHAFLYAGRQIAEMWNYIPLCWHHHLGPGLNKERNRQLAAERATFEDKLKYPKLDWKRYTR